MNAQPLNVKWLSIVVMMSVKRFSLTAFLALGRFNQISRFNGTINFGMGGVCFWVSFSPSIHNGLLLLAPRNFLTAPTLHYSMRLCLTMDAGL